MIVSRNEIETTCQRAALGVGLAHGFAEDAAAIAARLAADGEDVAAIMLTALSSIEENGIPIPYFNHDERLWRSAEQAVVPALMAGPCAADLLRAEPRRSRPYRPDRRTQGDCGSTGACRIGRCRSSP